MESIAIARFKMSLLFKYSDFLSSVYPFSLNFRASYSAKRDILKAILGISQSEADLVLLKNKKIGTMPAERITETIGTLEDHGLDGKKIVSTYPILCCYSKNRILRDIRISKECGINIRRKPGVLTHLLQILAKSPIELKKNAGIDETFDVLENLKAILRLPNELASFSPSFPRRFSEEDTLKELREGFMIRYLNHEFGWSPQVILEFITKHFRAFVIPLEQLHDTVRVLNTTLQAKPNWVLKHNTVLALHKNDIIALLKSAEDLGISNFKDSAITHPRLLWLKPQRLQSIVSILTSHGASVDVLTVSPQLLLFKPSTLDANIRKVGLVPYLDALRSNKRFGDVIYNVNRAVNNIKAVDSSNSSGTTITTLVGTQKNFDRYLQDNVRRNHDVFNYLVSVFPNRDRKLIRKQIIQHPQYLAADLVSVVETLNYLRSRDFDNESVFAALPILFYSKTVVQQAYDFVAKEWQIEKFQEYNNTQKLHFILYTIEKPYHFSGDGVFCDEFVSTGGSLPVGLQDIDIAIAEEFRIS